MTQSDSLLRAQVLEAYECVPSLDAYGELTRLILTEVSLLTEKYRNVRRHDIPHLRELAGLLDVLWQEIEMGATRPPRQPDAQPVAAPALFAAPRVDEAAPADAAAPHRPVLHEADFER